MNKKLVVPLVIVLAILLLGSQSIFYVNENERAIVLRLGELAEKNAREPGINFKLPFIENVAFFENRIIVLEIAKTESLTSDLKTFEIDNYACWRIVDPPLFYRKLRTERVADDRLRNIIYSNLRTAIGNKELNEVVFTKRTEIMDNVLMKSDSQAREYGVSIVDVRIKRTDLPNRLAIFGRMNAERTRMANKYRSEGESEDRRIRSEAELQRDTLIAEANRKSITLRGEADATAIRIFAAALSTDPEFYDFLKSLEVYRKAFKDNTRMVLSNDDPLLHYMR